MCRSPARTRRSPRSTIQPHDDRPASVLRRRGDTRSSVLERLYARASCTVSTAEDLTVRLHTVTDDPATAVGTTWRERLDRTLEAVERTPHVFSNDIERLVVIVAANLADRHEQRPTRPGRVVTTATGTRGEGTRDSMVGFNRRAERESASYADMGVRLIVVTRARGVPAGTLGQSTLA